MTGHNLLSIISSSFLSFSLVTCLLVAAGARGDEASKVDALKKFAEMQNERLKEGRPPLTLIDLVNLYDEEDRRQIIIDTVNNNGVFFPIKGRWKLIDEASIAISWALHENEPLEPEALNVLERLLPSSKDPQERTQMAALLYRYHRKSGWNYLIKQLREESDATATLVLTLNRENALLEDEDLMQVLNHQRANPKVIYALGQWGPETSNILGDWLLNSDGVEFECLLALSMAKHRIDGDLQSYIQKRYAQGFGLIKTAAAAALIRVDPEDKQIMQFLTRLAESPGAGAELHRYLAIEALGRVKANEARRVLANIVRNYVSQDDAGHPTSEVIEAARSLALTQNNAAAALSLQMLKHMINSGVTDQHTLNTVGVALLDGGNQGAEKEVSELLGARLVETVRGTSDLNHLPADLLPVASRKILAKPYSVDRSR